MNILNGLFGKNDWTPVWTERATWNQLDHATGKPVVVHAKFCAYEILLSKSRNQLKLEVHGFRPKEHPKYKDAVEMLNELTLRLNK